MWLVFYVFSVYMCVAQDTRAHLDSIASLLTFLPKSSAT